MFGSVIDELARVGKVYEGIVQKISWTQATVLFSDGVTSYVSSKDLGLSPWAEAQTAVYIGERIRVRVTAVDKINRIVSVAFAGRALEPGG